MDKATNGKGNKGTEERPCEVWLSRTPQPKHKRSQLVTQLVVDLYNSSPKDAVDAQNLH